MSNKFIWVRNPTALNGLSTLYVSKRGSDTLGDGSAQNPYASIAKITSVALTNTNIMLDDGEWNEARTMNSRRFHYWGNAFTSLLNNLLYNNEHFHYMHICEIQQDSFMYHCFIEWGNGMLGGLIGGMEYCIFISNYNITLRVVTSINNCIIKCVSLDVTYSNKVVFNNCIFIIQSIPSNNKFSFIHCNFTNTQLPGSTLSYMVGCINDSITGQTVFDYFNHYDPNNWENCDFTAKLGSANIGAGTKGSTIGLNQGYPCKVDNTSNDIFSTASGAELRSVHYNTVHNGYVLSHKDEVCVGATSNTFTLSNNAETIDNYYNGLFIFITSGDGSGETHYITDYDGATRTATIEDTFTTIPNTGSVYSLSGTITSAVKDFSKIIKIKRNWTFQDVFADDNGEWAELLTHVTKDGKIAKISSFKYKYSVDGSLWRDSDDLVSATDGETKTQDYTKGDCSEDYNGLLAKPTVMRYVQFFIHIGVTN